MSAVLKRIREDLKVNVNPQTQRSFQRFFKEQVKYYGVKVPVVSKIAKKYWKEVKGLGKDSIFSLCEGLFGSDYTEEALIVSFWLPKYVDHLQPGDVEVFRDWIDRFVNNWVKCDSFCNHTVGDLIMRFPEVKSEVKGWAKSRNPWLRRASAVSFIVPAKKGLFLRDALEICDVLLVDGDDLVQKGYGWLLKEESRMHQMEVYEYVVKNRSVMPRTALRYAIELMPKELKAEAMRKN